MNDKKIDNIVLISYLSLTFIVFAFFILYTFFYEPSIKKLINTDNIKKIKIVDSFFEEVNEKYSKDKVYFYNKKVNLNEIVGYVYYVRGKNNINVFHTSYDTSNTSSNLPILVQIKEFMDYFDKSIIEEMNLEDEDNKINIIGKSNYKFNLPIEESILKENNTYIKEYKVRNKKYQIKYYMENEHLVCEMIKFIK